MGVRLIVDREAGPDSVAMYDSVTGWAFGPVFDNEEDAEAFIGWLPVDARTYDSKALQEMYRQFLERTPA